MLDVECCILNENQNTPQRHKVTKKVQRLNIKILPLCEPLGLGVFVA